MAFEAVFFILVLVQFLPSCCSACDVSDISSIAIPSVCLVINNYLQKLFVQSRSASPAADIAAK